MRGEEIQRTAKSHQAAQRSAAGTGSIDRQDGFDRADATNGEIRRTAARTIRADRVSDALRSQRRMDAANSRRGSNDDRGRYHDGAEEHDRRADPHVA